MQEPADVPTHPLKYCPGPQEEEPQAVQEDAPERQESQMQVRGNFAQAIKAAACAITIYHNSG